MKLAQANQHKKSPRSANVGQYLMVSRGIGGGKLLFKGTRIAVRTVLIELAKGETFKQLLVRWPSLERKALAEAVRLAGAALVLRSGARPWSTDDPSFSTLLNGRQDKKPIKPSIPVAVGKHLIDHADVCFGRLTFKPTRVPVQVVMAYLAKGKTPDRLTANWPRVTRQAITEAIELAAAAFVERYENRSEADDEPNHSGRTA
jgi:uncharacterized protein (DUF433 family)